MKRIVTSWVWVVVVVLGLSPACLAEAIWWTDSATGTIGTANLDGTNAHNLLTDLNAPQGLALDLVHGKMYWVESDSIRRANLDGSGVQTLVTGLDAPHGITLHLAGGKMYWTQRGGVSRANLIGSNVQSVVTNLPDPTPQHIAIDVVHAQLYWADSVGNVGQIHTAAIDGSGHTVLVEFVPETATPKGMAVNITGAGGHIYWTDATGTATRADEQGNNLVQLIGSGLSGPGDIALHVAAGHMYLADRFSVVRANVDGTNVTTLVDGLARGEGIAINVTPPGLQPPVLTAPVTNTCDDSPRMFCGEVIVDFVAPVRPGDWLAFNLHPIELAGPANLFTTLTVEIDGRVVAELNDYIPGEVMMLNVDEQLNALVPHTFAFFGELTEPYTGTVELGLDVISPSLIPEPATLAILILTSTAMMRRQRA